MTSRPGFSYSGTELEAVAEARNYYEWIVDSFAGRRAFDHFRRYTRSGLRKQLLDAGFEIETLRYLNMLGVAAWFVSGRIFHGSTLGRSQVRFYDRWVIPGLRAIETRFQPPLGQSLLAIARKPGGPA